MTDPVHESEDAVELAEIRQQIKDDILRRVLATWEGRHVLFDIVGRGDLYGLHGEMPFEAEKLNRCVGRQQVAQEVLLEALRVDPDVYILMQQETAAFEAQFKLREATGENDE